MAYIRLSDGTYPFSEAQVRAAYPNKILPTPMPCPAEFAVVFEAPRPSFNALTHYVAEVSPQQVNGKWVQQWVTIELGNDEKAAAAAEYQRNLVAGITAAIQDRLDDFAKTRGYDGILSACTYATSPTPKFATEGQYCIAQRDATWAAAYAILADVEAQNRPAPAGYAAIEAELPALVWPV